MTGCVLGALIIADWTEEGRKESGGVRFFDCVLLCFSPHCSDSCSSHFACSVCAHAAIVNGGRINFGNSTSRCDERKRGEPRAQLVALRPHLGPRRRNSRSVLHESPCSETGSDFCATNQVASPKPPSRPSIGSRYYSRRARPNILAMPVSRSCVPSSEQRIYVSRLQVLGLEYLGRARTFTPRRVSEDCSRVIPRLC